MQQGGVNMCVGTEVPCKGFAALCEVGLRGLCLLQKEGVAVGKKRVGREMGDPRGWHCPLSVLVADMLPAAARPLLCQPLLCSAPQCPRRELGAGGTPGEQDALRRHRARSGPARRQRSLLSDLLRVTDACCSSSSRFARPGMGLAAATLLPEASGCS